MDKEVRELEKALEQIWDIAVNKFGLDPFPTRFEIVPSTVMYEVGSYALPGRYSHWTFGKAYHKMKTMYDFGLSKIYEVVINSNPSYAFLLENNSLLQNKLVIAHVLGHVDFFKHNAYFSQTNRRMIDDAALHARRINEYEFKYGRKVVEDFLDAVLSIEEHIDPYFFIKKDSPGEKAEERQISHPRPYDDLISSQEREALAKAEAAKAQEKQIPPEKDLIWYIMQNSPALQPWQRDVLSMIHEEMLYFVPQMQTKTLNEGWACATGDSLLATENGFLRFDEIYESQKKIQVGSGGQNELNRITDFHKEEKVPTIRVRTRNGFTIEGAEKHRVMLADGTWAYLNEINIGSEIRLAGGTNIWPVKKQVLNFPSSAQELSFGAAAAGLSQVATGAALAWTPIEFNEKMAWHIGYFIGDGDLATEDQELALRLSEIINETSRDLPESIGLWAGNKNIPSIILRSPKSVMSAFLKGYFDAIADIGTEGIHLISADEELIKSIQIILLNYGIVSSRRRNHDIQRLEISGRSALSFLSEIGFSLPRKQEALSERLINQNEDLTDQIVEIEYGSADVYDITVAEKHSYVANGFVNHNSFWHSRIMRELDLPDHEHVEFAELHAGVVSPHRGQLNPYYVGYKILEDIEKRWNNPSAEERERFGREPGQGWAKLFEVRETENDISLLRNYLTEDLCEELDLFVYELVDEEEWTVTDKRWEHVRDQLVANMTNFGYPYIEVADGDYDGNLELLLRHRYEGAELDLKYARKVLEYVHKLWGRPVHLDTTIEEEATTLHYDGEEHSES